jgi:putative tryptophan/tyrosine transport system substrate-binding protein
MIRRREFIAGLGSAAAWPVVARAQQPAMPVVGVLSQECAGSYVAPEFRQGLSQAGYIEGRNVAFDYHWAGDQYDQLPALAADLVHRHVGVIYANGLPASEAAKAATSIIPVVFLTGANPVQLGLVASLNRPGGHVTGVTNLAGELNTKRLELLHEAIPTAKLIAVLVNPTEPNAVNLARNFEAAAGKLGLESHILHASTERDFDTVITTLQDRRAGALVISPDVFFLPPSRVSAPMPSSSLPMHSSPAAACNWPPSLHSCIRGLQCKTRRDVL